MAIGTDAEQLDAEGLRLLEEARGRWQRRRATIYCVFGAILNCLWLGSTLSEWMLAESPTFSDRLDTASTFLLGLLYVVAAIGFSRMRPDPNQVARRLGWVTIAGGMMIVVAVMLVVTFDADLAPPEYSPLLRSIAAAATALLFIFALHFVAALFVALPPWPAFWPLIPLWVAYAAGVFSIEGTSLGVRAILAGLFPLAGAPGLAWSVVRHQRWVDRFKIELLGDRYGQIRRDLAEARRVHEGIFPQPVDDGALRLRYAYEPMREIGGDFLFARRGEGGALLLVIVDVTGHGVASALAVTRIHAVLSLLAGPASEEDDAARGAARDEAHRAARDDELDRAAREARRRRESTLVRPGTLLARLNAFVEESLAPQGVYATAVAVAVEPERGELRWASAGHPPGLVRRWPKPASPPEAGEEAGAVALVELASTCPMLGVLPPAAFEPDEQRMLLAPGDSLLLCTDGLLEAVGSGGAMFGLDRLRSELLAAPDAELADLPGRLLEAIRSFRIGPPTDDTLVVELTRQRGG